MLDDSLKSQLAAYLERLREPVQLIASLDEREASAEMRELIEEIAALAQSRGIGMHVDGCLGGWLLPWVERLGYDVPLWDFRVPGVTSISADTHKYGYALKGSSVLLYRSRDLRKHQYFTYPGWPGGLYLSPGLAGSRSGGIIASTYAAILATGASGYLAAADAIMSTATAIKNGINGDIPELDRFIEAMIGIRHEISEIENGKADKADNVLKMAPHTSDEVCGDTWSHPYGREKAAFPVSVNRDWKYWPTVNRVDNAHGDRNLICTCPPTPSIRSTPAAWPSASDTPPSSARSTACSPARSRCSPAPTRAGSRPGASCCRPPRRCVARPARWTRPCSSASARTSTVRCAARWPTARTPGW